MIVDSKGLSPSTYFKDARGSAFDPITTIHDTKVMEQQAEWREGAGSTRKYRRLEVTMDECKAVFGKK